MKRRAPGVPPVPQLWYRKVWGSLKAQYFPMDSDERKDIAATLAGYIALVGDDSDEDALCLFRVLILLYSDSKRTQRWKNTTALLPADREKLVKFARLIDGYEKLAQSGRVGSLHTSAINLEKVVLFSLKVCDKKEAFLQAAEESWMDYPSAIFSDRFLREAARTHRGAFGDFAESSPDEFDRIEVVG